MDFKEGITSVYKPKGPTSHDVVAFIKRHVPRGTNVGHAGTLDPLAKGVLVVGIGREATKTLQKVVEAEKEYIALVRLGGTSGTDDLEGDVKPHVVEQRPTRRAVEEATQGFIGTIEQVPPRFSAAKVGGVRAYKRARQEQEFDPGVHTVVINEIEVLHYKWPDVTLRVVTGSGVYIRSLARDLGGSLGVGGYIADLERTRVGQFTKEQAINIDLHEGTNKGANKGAKKRGA